MTKLVLDGGPMLVIPLEGGKAIPQAANQPTRDKRMDIIVDIDGTVADIGHRLHHVQTHPQDWNAFFDDCGLDTPIEWVCEIVKRLSRAEDTRLLFITSRPERIRGKTMDWLQVTLEVTSVDMLMRKDGDHRPDHVIKGELLEIARQHGYRPVIAIEDRQQVVDMYRAQGLLVLQCADGRY